MLAVVASSAACSDSTADGPDSGAERQAGQIVADAAVAMADVESAAFTIEQSGATLFIDDGDQLGFQSAVGRYASPSSAEAIISVSARGFATQVGAVAIDGTIWFTNPLTGAWAEAPESFTLDPTSLFDDDAGFPALLNEATTTAELIEDAPAEDDTDLGRHHHVRTAVSAQRVAALTGGLIAEETDVDLWIDTDTNRMVEARFDLQIDAETSSWRLTFDDYDAEVDIVAPELGIEG